MKIIEEHMAQHVTHVQGHKVKYGDRHNSTADCSILLKFGTELDHVTADILQMFKIKSKKVKVIAQRNASAVKTLQDSNGQVDRLQTWHKRLRVGNDCRGIWRSQVAMHSQLPHFLVVLLSLLFY